MIRRENSRNLQGICHSRSSLTDKHQIKISPMPVNWESSPTVKSMKKNKVDHRGEIGSLERASGYAMNAKPNPARNPAHRHPTTSDAPHLRGCIIISRSMWCFCLTFLHHLSNRHFVQLRHVTQDWKYGKSCQHAGACDAKRKTDYWGESLKRSKACAVKTSVLLPALMSVTTNESLNTLLWKLL